MNITYWITVLKLNLTKLVDQNPILLQGAISCYREPRQVKFLTDLLACLIIWGALIHIDSWVALFFVIQIRFIALGANKRQKIIYQRMMPNWNNWFRNTGQRVVPKKGSRSSQIICLFECKRIWTSDYKRLLMGPTSPNKNGIWFLYNTNTTTVQQPLTWGWAPVCGTYPHVRDCCTVVVLVL
jgi:hypothetical protein